MKLLNIYKNFIFREFRKQYNNYHFFDAIPKFDNLFEVGVGLGEENFLYENNKFNNYYLVEPNKQLFDIALNKFKKRNNFYLFNIAASNKKERKTFYNNTTGSSFYLKNKNLPKTLVNCDKLDSIIEEKVYINKKNFLKIDTEGHDLQVLLGSKKLLKHVHLIMLEISTLRRFEQKSYNLVDLMAFLSKSNFKNLFIMNVGRIQNNKYIRYLDIIFVKKRYYKYYCGIL